MTEAITSDNFHLSRLITSNHDSALLCPSRHKNRCTCRPYAGRSSAPDATIVSNSHQILAKPNRSTFNWGNSMSRVRWRPTSFIGVIMGVVLTPFVFDVDQSTLEVIA
jgi:hypothetical protein